MTGRRLEREGRPTSSDLKRKATLWEYEQAENDPEWDDEARAEALTAAFARRESDPSGAFAACLELAEAGSRTAMVEVGEGFEIGRRTTRDIEKAEMWLRRAYELGSQRAVLSYGGLLTRHADLAGAERVFRPAAAEGWAPAVYRLASILLRRDGDPVSIEEGRALLEQAAALGHPGAKVHLGREMILGRYGLARVPHGFRLLMAYINEVMAEAGTVVRRTPSGETLH